MPALQGTRSTTVQDAPDTARSPQHLIESCQGLVKSIAWKIHRKLPPQVELNDVIAYGQLGLVQAARDFDSARGGQFTTYAYYRIRGAILDGLSQMSWFSRAAYHSSRYERMSSDVLSQNAEDSLVTPSSSVADHAVDKQAELDREVQWFSELTARLSVVYLSSGCADGSKGQPEPIDDAPTPPGDAIANEMRVKLSELIEKLPPPARSLIRATYFEGVTMQEAGSRLGISKAWASRLHARTLDQLARSLRRSQGGA